MNRPLKKGLFLFVAFTLLWLPYAYSVYNLRPIDDGGGGTSSDSSSGTPQTSSTTQPTNQQLTLVPTQLQAAPIDSSVLLAQAYKIIPADSKGQCPAGYRCNQCVRI